MKLFLVILTGFVIYAIAQFITLLVTAAMDIDVGIHGQSFWDPAVTVVLFGLPLAIGFLGARYLYRRLNIAISRTLSFVITISYFVSFAFGVPAAQTSRDTWAVNEYKRLKASGSPRVWENHPYIASYVSFPVLPAIIFTYHEYQLDGLYGFGGFEVSFWYLLGTKRLLTFPIWLS